MLFLTINSLEEVEAAFSAPVDALELRLDRFPSLDLVPLAKICRASPLPLLFTLRNFVGTEKSRLHLLEELLKLEPAYLDLEHDMPLPDFGKTKLILSYHNFEETPDLETLFSKMQKKEAYAYKIACMAKSPLDALRMCAFLKDQNRRITGICMGKQGELTRILAPVFGSWASYTSPAPTNAHQLSLDAYTTYRYRLLNQHTKIYALLGNPVDKSPSHMTHNAIFTQLGINAVYVKIPLAENELAPFFSAIRNLPFCGFSVTMPHKQAVIPFMDTLTSRAKAAGAVNTIRVHDGKLYGDNTDGIGALDALEEHGAVREKKLLLLGAGGSARAIAAEAAKRGARVQIFNRTNTRAQEVAKALRLQSTQNIPDDYDILVNTAPVTPLALTQILPGHLVMDIVFGKTELLDAAREKNCHTIPGKELFIRQAAYQFAFWFEGIDRTEITKMLSTALQKW